MSQIRINLLTKEFRGSNTQVTDGTSAIVAVIAILALVALGAWQLITYVKLSADQAGYRADLITLQREVNKLQKTVNLADSVQRSENQVKKIKNSGPSFNQLLADIQANTPEGVTITQLSIQNGSIQGQVSAANLIAVEQFSDSLRSVQGFSNVKLQSLSQDKGKPVQASFVLNCAQGGGGK